MSGVFLLDDPDDPVVRPLSRLRSRFSLRDGALSSVDRLRLRHPGCHFVFRHPDPAYEALIAESEGMAAWSRTESSAQAQAEPLPGAPLSVPGWLAELPGRITEDIELILSRRAAEFRTADSPRVADRFHDLSVHVIGPPDRLFLHHHAEVRPGSVCDVRAGPVLLDEYARVSPFSFLEGPLYVGAHARLDNVRLTGGCVVGRHARVGGEIENCIINDFSNKHHEGFLGHSVVAPWVNLGALATTSDLKNNYGPVRLRVPADAVDVSKPTGLLSVDTGTIKFGSILGECVKVGIGTMLSTGTVIDVGANVFGESPAHYVPPFRWSPDSIYEYSRFVHDAQRIFARRGEKPGARFEELARRAHPVSARGSQR